MTIRHRNSRLTAPAGLRALLTLLRATKILAIGLGAFSVSAHGQTGVIQTIVETGSGGVPGVPGANFESFSSPVLNDSGRIAFAGRLQTGGGITNDNNDGVWGPNGAGNLSLIAQEGSGGVPGVPGASFGSFNLTLLTPAGTTAFQSNLRIGGSVTSNNDGGFWGPDGSGNLSLIAREGSGGVPGVPGANYSFIANTPALSAAGHMAFGANMELGGSVTATNDTGIWGPDNSGNFSLIAREGSGGVIGVPGASFASLASHVPTLSPIGKVAFRAPIALGGSVTNSNDFGLWGPDNLGNLSLIAREGSGGVPGMAGANFANFSARPALNATGMMAFVGSLQTGTGGVTSNNDIAIWKRDALGNLNLIAREGSGGVPDIPGSSFFEFSDPPALNAAGQIAFIGKLQTAGSVNSGNDSGIWGPGAAGGLNLIVREGSGGVPGIPGASFSDINTARPFAMNAGGQLAFTATLQIAGTITADNDNGIWMGDGTDLLAVVREGQLLAGKTVSNVVFAADRIDESTRSGLNVLGQVAYQAIFTDSSSGIFLYTPDLHWRGTAGDGMWDSRTNFTLSLEPAHVHRVFLDPATSTTIESPAANTTLASLQIGGGAGAATLRLANGVSLEAVAGVEVVNNGTISGTGTIIGDVVSNGALAPGSSPGAMTIDGNLVSNGAIDFELGGTGPGEFDRLLVGNDFAVGGILKIILGYTPSLGDTFDIMDFATFTDNGYAFDFSQAPLDAPFQWNINEFSTTGTISVVPEPTSLLLVGLGVLVVAFPWRRRVK